MAAALTDDAQLELPPVKVVENHDGTSLVWDDLHTSAAYASAGREQVPVEIHAGDWRKAWELSLGANATHGLVRTAADVVSRLRCNVCVSRETDAPWHYAIYRDGSGIVRTRRGWIRCQRAGRRPVLFDLAEEQRRLKERAEQKGGGN
jgi:hypothetical protein